MENPASPSVVRETQRMVGAARVHPSVTLRTDLCDGQNQGVPGHLRSRGKLKPPKDHSEYVVVGRLRGR